MPDKIFFGISFATLLLVISSFILIAVYETTNKNSPKVLIIENDIIKTLELKHEYFDYRIFVNGNTVIPVSIDNESIIIPLLPRSNRYVIVLMPKT